MSAQSYPRHACGLSWCENGGTTEVDHWAPTEYVPGRLSIEMMRDPSGDTLPTVGIGASTIDGVPAVYVHITGGKHDSQADMTLADAIALRDRLDTAIRNAEEAQP